MGRIDLRLSETDFWQLSPREFFALWDRHTALLRAQAGEAPDEAPRELTPQETALQLRQWSAAHNKFHGHSQ